MENLQVLVVDDHEEFRRSLESLLGAMDGVEVIGRAGDGQAGGRDGPRACNPTWC